ncbi:MAG: shikimate kinase [Bacteroidetes bacterium]|nr:shikimate kinase [Bacteroidota bacterium]MCY4232512.1 shikimate kinase [Bacteroidota bacterium]
MTPQRICLTGFMGSGKSSVGIKLADILSKKFIDLDKKIESLADATIQDIFANSGEEGFRELETSALISLPNNIVCALGGGALTRPENFSWVLNESWVIYLRVEVPELVSRLTQDQTVRPLLRDKDGNSLSENSIELQVRKLLKHREPIYSQAHYIINCDGLSPIDVANKCSQAYCNLNDLR